MYFAIYYHVSDGAFRRAAETWKDELKRLEGITDDTLFLMHEVRTETEFRDAWSDIHRATTNSFRSAGIVQGRIFSHSSYDEAQDGLEFRRDPAGGHDGTLTRNDISLLDQLHWNRERGHLILHGCNSAVTTNRGWCPAEEFARRQGIRTTGQQGYAYFSQVWDSYEEIDATGLVYLWAYRRRKNGLLGDGSRMEGLIFSPPGRSASSAG